MIFNKGISIVLSGLFFLCLALFFSTLSVIFLKGGLLPVVGLVMFVIFYFITRVFYNYLRNDEKYKNNRQVSSDMPGEKYYTKGESDPKKLFIVIWLIVILILGWVPKRPKGKDLRSFGIGLRGFESLPIHYFIIFHYLRLCLSGSGGRALPW